MATAVTFVRIYLTESDKLVKPIMAYLHDELHIKGVSLFRAVSGFGQSGKIHSSDLITMALDLPLAVEFFDEPSKATVAIKHIGDMLSEGHIVSWPAQVD